MSGGPLAHNRMYFLYTGRRVHNWGWGGGGLSANENFRHSLKVTNTSFSVSQALSKT